MTTSNKGAQLNWCGQPIKQGEGYGGRPENIPPAQVVISRKQQRLDVLRRLINEGTTGCKAIAQAMGLPKYTISRMAKRAKKAGWLGKVKRKYVIVNARK